MEMSKFAEGRSENCCGEEYNLMLGGEKFAVGRSKICCGQEKNSCGQK